jgi:hypothetical protein
MRINTRSTVALALALAVTLQQTVSFGLTQIGAKAGFAHRASVRQTLVNSENPVHDIAEASVQSVPAHIEPEHIHTAQQCT